MSASSGIVAKGEKVKAKFQSLDINNLYKATENEPTQQKGTLLRTKNGMQSLGKVPTARRPPANLPSLKSESSGSEPAVSLVPAGAAGWGSKPGEGPPTTQQPPAPTSNTGTMPPQPAPVAVVAPVVMVPPTHEQVMHNMMPGADKSWSAVMAREQVPTFLAHQSPQFQQEFPKLASEGAAAGVAGKPGDAQYGPGPSLRPQTEGSWTSGGGRPPPGGPLGPTPQSLGPAHHGPPGTEPGGARTNLGPHPAAGVVMGPGGPAGMPFPAGSGYRPVPHNFIMPRAGSFVPPMAGIRQRFPGPGYPLDRRFPPGRGAEGDDPVTRPIIRDEELNKMDEIARDPGWAAVEDIDYNQQLAFSDNEENEGDSSKKDARKDRNDKNRGRDDENSKEKIGENDRRSEERGAEKRNPNWDRGGRHRGYPSGADDDRRKPRDDETRKPRETEDERRKIREAEEMGRKMREIDEERRKHRELEEERRKEEDKRKVREEVEAACQLARQRREDEVKRFDESKKNERRDWDSKRDGPERDGKRSDDHRDTKRESDHGKFDRDAKRDNDHGKRDSEHAKYDRDGDGKYERDGKRENDHGKYDYRNRMDGRDFRQGARQQQYKSLPPRLQAQADRMNSQHRSTASPQPPSATTNNYDSHWTHVRRYGGESGDENRDRHTPDTYGDRYKSNQNRDRYQDRHNFNDQSDHRRHFDRKERESESERPEDGYKKPEQTVRPSKDDRKEPSSEREAWRAAAHNNDRELEDERRPQRPDSRDSRTSRDSRNSREDKHENDTKPLNARNQHREEKVDTKGPAKHAATPPRELPDTDKKSNQSTLVAIPKSDAQTTATDEPKDAKEDKSSPLDENKLKGSKSSRGNRWGSGPTTFVRNGARGERRRRISGSGYVWPENESGSSGEGGSELEKGEKEERNKETRRSGDGTGRDGFAPSGQPSRRGRGAARVRGGGGGGGGGGGSANVPRRMDGSYGPPPIKATFSQPEPPAPVVEEEEDPTKQKQAALNAGIAGGSAKAAAAAAAAAAVAGNQRPATTTRPQRTQSNRDTNRSKTSRGKRPSGKAADGEEAWETNSEGDDRKTDSTRSRRGPAPPRGPPSSARSTSNRGPMSGALQKDNSRSAAATEIKEEKLPDSKPKISDNDGDSSQTSIQNDRGKKTGRDAFKGGKTENRAGSGNGAANKDRPERQERRGKPVTNQPGPGPTTPAASNPSGPQPLMSQVVNPPISMTKSFGGGNTWRQPTALPPRLQKQQDQQRQQNNDVNHDLSKMVPSIFPTKGESLSARDSAWEKPIIGSSSRSPAEQVASEVESQRSSPGNKLPIREDVLLDDSVPPVNTIIFENTNLKSGPGAFSTSLKQPPVVPKANEWKTGEELFGKSDLVVDPLPDHSIKSPMYRAEQGIEIENLLHSELSDMTDLKSFKRLADVKNLWADEQPNSGVFQAPFRQDSTIDPGFGKTVDNVVVTPDDCLINPAEVVYSPAPPSYGISKHDPNNSSNVCKVKPQQQTVLSTVHSPLGHTGQSPLSPPPFSSTQPGQFNYQQAGLGGNPGQFGGMPAIPSPPAGLSYSSQQLQPSSLFQFQLDRNQYSTQFSGPYGLSANIGNSSTFNQPQLYLSHPAPQQEMFSSISQFRVPHASPHTNPSTVLLPPSSNSLMSANVKPSSQNIGVIGSKASPYQQNSQMYFPYAPVGMSQNYLSGSGMVQRSAPVQSAAPDFYSSSPGQPTGFYSTPSSGLGQPMQSLQQPYGRQGFVSQSTTHNLQNYSNQVHMDMGYRNPGGLGPGSYLKSGVGNNSVSQQDVISSVFNSGPPKTRAVKQMSQPPPQQSPTQVSKFGNYSNANQMGLQQSQQNLNHQRMPQANMGLQGMRSTPRYPSPIQRPQSYNRGRSNMQQQQQQQQQQQRPGAKPYFEAQEGKLDEVSDLSKPEEASQLNCEPKLPEPVQPAKTDAGPEEDITPLKDVLKKKKR